MRDKSIDVLKGMAIIFVIYYHILWTAVGFKSSLTNVFFNTCCMQLFFFISGFLSYKPILKESLGKYTKDGIIKKVRYLLVPTILMFLFSIWFFKLDIVYWIKSIFHNGYWFTYVLFFIFLLHYLLVNPILTIIDKKWVDVLFVAGTFVLMVCSEKIVRYFDGDIASVFSIFFILKYWFFFTLGFVVAKHRIFDGQFLDRSYVRLVLFVIAVIPVHCFGEGLKQHLLECVVSPVRVIVIYQIVSGINYFKGEHFVSNQLAKIGRHTLEIYFLHYYFIFGMPKVFELLTQQLDMYVVKGPGATFTLELMIILPLSIIIAYLCILTRSVFNYSPLLSELLFGKIPDDKPLL